MREWLPFVDSTDESVVDHIDESVDSSPSMRALLGEENISATRTELSEAYEEDPEQAYFFAYAVGVALGFIALLYYFDGWLPWYVAMGYVFLILIGLHIGFDNAIEESPFAGAENAISKLFQR